MNKESDSYCFGLLDMFLAFTLIAVGFGLFTATKLSWPTYLLFALTVFFRIPAIFSARRFTISVPFLLLSLLVPIVAAAMTFEFKPTGYFAGVIRIMIGIMVYALMPVWTLIIDYDSNYQDLGDRFRRYAFELYVLLLWSMMALISCQVAFLKNF